MVAGDVDGLSVLTCGSLPPNPPELIASDGFISLVKALKSEFDWVVIDSPPVVGLVDAVHIASLADVTLLVIRHASTDRDLVRSGIAGLRRAGGHLAGAVLNDVDITRGDARSSYGAVYYPSRVTEEKARSSALRRPAAL